MMRFGKVSESGREMNRLEGTKKKKAMINNYQNRLVISILFLVCTLCCTQGSKAIIGEDAIYCASFNFKNLTTGDVWSWHESNAYERIDTSVYENVLVNFKEIERWGNYQKLYSVCQV